MKSSKTVIIVLALVIIVLAVWKCVPLMKGNLSSSAEETSGQNSGTVSNAANTSVQVLPAPAVPTHPNVTVDTAVLSAPLKSPLVLTGTAKLWYFEGSFPVELKDSTGAVIATGVAEAQSDWMSTNFVPFTLSLNFPAQPAGSTGTLVLKKDNPSGEPANDDQFVLPISF